jgi:hypothetical protein
VIYDWDCQSVSCHARWEVIATVAERDEPSYCPKCGGQGVRSQVYLVNVDKVAAGDWNRVSYNPGLGEWTKSWKHGREIAKSRGLEEVGNTAPEALHRQAEQTQADTRERRWADADREKVYE